MKDKVMRILGIMLLLTIILQGCGRKGPLFLPAAPIATPQAVPAQPASAQPSPEKSESKK
jgi:predicted small lipoprotein YifL